MIVVVAPYSPIGLSATPTLGAARKLQAVIGLLSTMGKVVLVNSAHNALTRAPLRVETIRIGELSVPMIIPPVFASRPVGKLLNLLQLNQVMRALRAFGRPRMAWLYNGYAFENLMAGALSRSFHCPVVLEFEDWHFARRRGWSVKPYIDAFSWIYALRFINAAFAVNAELQGRLQEKNVPAYLLPGIVPVELAELFHASPPFPTGMAVTRVGYFGGLSTEKGVDMLLAAIARAPAGLHFTVSGTGPLQADVASCAERHPERLCFAGRVDDARLNRLIGDCDVIVNPHKSIDEMRGGVFPFKVIEAIASGRLLITTTVPGTGLESVLAAVKYFDGSVDGLLAALLGARQHYQNGNGLIEAAAREAQQRFSSDAVAGIVERLMDSADPMPMS